MIRFLAAYDETFSANLLVMEVSVDHQSCNADKKVENNNNKNMVL